MQVRKLWTKTPLVEPKQRVNTGTNLSIVAFRGHTLFAESVAGAVDTRSLHPAAAQRKLLQPLRVARITSLCREEGRGRIDGAFFTFNIK